MRWERTEQHAACDLRTGTYVLRTSHVDWDPVRLAETYWRLNEVEATFRSLNGEIGLRPIWHAKQDRIRAHLFRAVLAYHGVHPHQLGQDPAAAVEQGAADHDADHEGRGNDQLPPGHAPQCRGGGARGSQRTESGAVAFSNPVVT